MTQQTENKIKVNTTKARGTTAPYVRRLWGQTSFLFLSSDSKLFLFSVLVKGKMMMAYGFTHHYTIQNVLYMIFFLQMNTNNLNKSIQPQLVNQCLLKQNSGVSKKIANILNCTYKLSLPVTGRNWERCATSDVSCQSQH